MHGLRHVVLLVVERKDGRLRSEPEKERPGGRVPPGPFDLDDEAD